jgi:diguanylate cyclase (GGDEF)-like protein
VLIVEPQRALSEMLASMLRAKWGGEVVIAASQREAQDLLDARGSDFIAAICSLSLPDAPLGGAIELANRHGISPIALTSTVTKEVRDLAAQGHIVDYVLKKGVDSYDYVVQLIGRLHRNADTKVLVADDSQTSRDTIKRMLGVQRLNVVTADNGAEALTMLDKHPDTKLVLVDYNMPKVDGFEFLMQARRRIGKDRLSIIGISGENRAEVSAQFLKHGANDFISKPYSYEEMTCRVNQNLEMLEMLESMQNLAHRDFLTGIYNRRYFFSSGNDALRQARLNNCPVYVAMLDIDHFKQVNDTYGHDCGDLVLKCVAESIQKHFPHDLVARIGGEEFAVLVTNVDATSVRAQLEKLRQTLAATVVSTPAKDVAVTISLGGCDAHEGSLDEMLKAADGKLYQAKLAGRNRLMA